MTAVREGESDSVKVALPARVGAVGTRRTILQTALSLLAVRGYHGVSMRDIARETGLSVSSLYGHFATKEDMLATLVIAGVTEHHERLVDAVADAGPDPVAAIRAFVTVHIEVHLELPTLARVAHRELEALSEAHLRQVLALHQESRSIVTAIVDRGRLAGTFRVEDSRLAVMAIGAMGLRLGDAWVPTSDMPSAVLTRNYVEFALRLLGVADGGMAP